jgi:hypothetical protein
VCSNIGLTIDGTKDGRSIRTVTSIPFSPEVA